MKQKKVKRMGMFWVIFLIIAYGILILGFIVTIKKYHDMKKENDRLEDMIMKFETGATTKEQKLQEYQSIIDKIKDRYKDSKDEKKKVNPE